MAIFMAIKVNTTYLYLNGTRHVSYVRRKIFLIYFDVFFTAGIKRNKFFDETANLSDLSELGPK